MALTVAVLASACSSSSKPVANATTSTTASSTGSGATSPAGSTTVDGLTIPVAGLTTLKYGQQVDTAVNPAPAAPSGGNGGATAQGVTASTINLGQIASLTGPVSGQWTGMVDAAQAYANYVNSLGGIYGRKLTISVGDDQYDVVKDRAVCQNIVPKVFAQVSDFNLGDAGCYPLLQSTGEPEIGPIVFDPQLAGLPNVFAPTPDTYSNLADASALAIHPGVKKVWVVEENQPGIQAQAAPEEAVWKSLGVTPINVALLPANAPNYTAQILQAKDAGAQAVDCFSCAVNLLAQVAQEMQQQGWNPPIKQGFAVYSPVFNQLAGSAAKGWLDTVQVPVLDPSLFSSTSAGQLYTKWAGNPATKPNPSITVYGWEYMALFDQAAVKAGPDLTWPKLEAALKSLTNFTAGGLVPPITAKGENTGGSCLSIWADTGATFQQVVPPTAGQLVCGGKLFSA
jgi:branched-chain amino acid transport system substrate-binding protein